MRAGRPVEMPLGFLTAGGKYVATVYSDQIPDRPESKDVKIKKRTVDATIKLTAKMSPNGGQAMRIVPLVNKGEKDRRGSFAHPGLLHSAAALQRMRQRVAKAAEPWQSGFEKPPRPHPQVAGQLAHARPATGDGRGASEAALPRFRRSATRCLMR